MSQYETSLHSGGAAEDVFILDDDPVFLELAKSILSSAGLRVEAFTAPDRFLASIGQRQPAAICLDLHVPGYEGAALLVAVRNQAPGVPVIMLTGDERSEMVVMAMRAGAFDYVTKRTSVDRLLLTVEHAIREWRLKKQVYALEHPPEGGRHFGRLYGRSPAMLALFRELDFVTEQDLPILIEGETGSGKSALALEVHGRSARRHHPFVELNLSTTPEPVQAGALFGYSRNLLRESAAARRGLLDQASGGTLLLRDVSELGPVAQAGLLRLLERGGFLRVGGNAQVPCDVRLIATTSRDLRPEVAAGRFRESLYFRLAAFDVRVPPLRERQEDILPLAHRLLREHTAALGAGQMDVDVSPDAVDALLAYAWPGNVRELSNALQRAAITSRGRPVSAGDLPAHVRAGASAKPSPPTQVSHHESAGETLESLERRAILAATARHGGNVAAVARELDISRATLYRKLKHYKLVPAGAAE